MTHSQGAGLVMCPPQAQARPPGLCRRGDSLEGDWGAVGRRRSGCLASRNMVSLSFAGFLGLHTPQVSVMIEDTVTVGCQAPIPHPGGQPSLV